MTIKDELAAVPPPVWVVTALGLQWVLKRKRRPAGPLRVVLAVGLAIGSIAVAAAAARGLLRRTTTLNPLEPEQATSLVTEGLQQYTRNPMYLGMAGLLTANALWRGSIVGVLPVLGFVTVIDQVQIPREEQALRATFGKDYDRYCAAVPRWLTLPGVEID